MQGHKHQKHGQVKMRFNFKFLALLFFLSTPAYAIDLTDWKLTLPLDSKGGMSGEAVEIKPLKQDYSHPKYFIRNGDSITFVAPVDGATTSGSKYARSELREMKGTERAAWKIKEGGILKSTLYIEEVPVKKDGKPGRIVIGQIHGSSNELCRLYYDNGQIYFYDDKAGSSKKETKFELKNKPIPLNDEFEYEIKVASGELTVTVINDGEAWVAKEKIGSYWTNDPLYFKAGVYLGVGKPGSGAGTTGAGQGRATFSNIAFAHGSASPKLCECPK